MMSENEPVSPVGGLSQPEVMILALMANGFSHNSATPMWSLKNDAERAGITGVGFNLGVRRLLSKKFIEETEEYDSDNHHSYTGVKLADRAWEWIEANESRFILHKGSKDAMEDDIPF